MSNVPFYWTGSIAIAEAQAALLDYTFGEAVEAVEEWADAWGIDPDAEEIDLFAEDVVRRVRAMKILR